MKTLMSHMVLTAVAALATTAITTHAQASICGNDGCYEKFGDSDEFGNSKFGADYSFYTRLIDYEGELNQFQSMADEMYSMAAHHPFPMNLQFEMMAQQMQMRADEYAQRTPDDYVLARADAEANITIFGSEKEIIDAYGYARLLGGSFSSNLNISVLGVSQSERSLTSVERELFSTTKTFFSARTTYMAGPVPITTTGSLDGTLYINGSLSTDGSSIELGVTPGLDLSGSIAAGVGVACASAGVRGNLTMIDASVPSTLELSTNGACGNRVTADIDSAVEMTTMGGSLEVYAEACGLEWSKEIVSWNGVTLPTIDLLDQTICI